MLMMMTVLMISGQKRSGPDLFWSLIISIRIGC